MRFALICTPETAIVETLRLLLGADWTIFSEKMGAQAIRMLDEVPADVVFIDEYLPDVQLLDVVAGARASHPTVPLVALALTANSPTVMSALPAGLNDVLTKPFDRDSVQLLLHRLSHQPAEHPSPMQAAALPGPQMPELAIHSPSSGPDHASLVHTLRTIFRVGAIRSDVPGMAQRVLDALCELCGLNRGVLLWEMPAAGTYGVIASQGVRRDRLDAVVFRVQSGLVGWMRSENRICLHQGPAGAHLPTLVLQELQLLQSSLAVPLVADGTLRGVLALGNKVTGVRFDASELDLIVCVAQYAATLLANAASQAAAREHQARYQGIVQNLASGIVMVDTDGRVEVINEVAANVLAVDRQAVVGQPAHRLGSLVGDLLLRTLAGERQYNRHRVINPTTQEPLGVNTALLRDEAGSVIGAVMVCTSLAHIPSDGAEASDPDGDVATWHKFALAMAHAIKNPLVAIKTFAQLYPDHSDDAEFREQFHPVAMREIDRLDHLIEQLTTYGSDARPQKERCDLGSLLGDLVSTQSGDTSEPAPIEVAVAAEDDPLIAFVDRDQVGVAITHLIDNAREAAGPEGHVWITARRQANGSVCAAVAVEDDGPGLPEAAGTIATSPFFTTKDKGLGLGLALTERIAQLHGGTVHIDRSEHGGARVTLQLPLAEVEQA